MKSAKKIVALLLCAVLLVGASVAGTLAYLTFTTGPVTNTFTVGKVNLGDPDPDNPGQYKNGLDEAKVNQYGELLDKDNNVWADGKDKADRVLENGYKLIPGHKYTKDPTIHVTKGSEPCYLFVKVVNGISAIEAAGDTTIAAQMTENDWTQLTVDGKSVENVFYYTDIVDASTASENVDVPVFGSFTLKADADLAGYEGKTITVTVKAYAVQADGFDSAVAAWKAAPTTWGE